MGQRTAYLLKYASALARLALAVAAVAGPGCAEDRPLPPATPAGPPLAELPVPRTEVAGTTWRGGLVVAGGLTADGAASALVHVYEPGVGQWRRLADLPVALHHAGVAAVGERVYVAGGYTNGPGGAWQPQAAVRSLAPGESAWRDEPPLPAGPRGALGLAAVGDLLVAVGGEAGGRALATTEVYDARAGAWRPGPDLALAREHLAVAAWRGRAHAVAGRAPGRGNFAEVESFDPVAGGPWRAEPPLEKARGGFAAAAVDDRLCVAGGEEEAGTIAPVECLGDDGWSTVGRLERPRHGLAVAALEGRLHVVAGGEEPGLTVSGVHEALEV